MTTHNPALFQNPEDITWSTSAMKTWKSKQERAWVSGHSLPHCSCQPVAASADFTSMLNQNHILAHQCIKCINLTQALMKILLVCWMNKCGSFTNLRNVDTLTLYIRLFVFFSSLNSQMTNKHEHFAQKRQQTLCSMYIFLIRSFILVKSCCTKHRWRMLLHNHTYNWLLYEEMRVIF
jgi:hypothetical protein